jgi:hypothetical protein
MSSEQNQFYPSHHSPIRYTQLINTHKKRQNYLGAHERLKSNLGDIFCRRNTLFSSLTVYFLWLQMSLHTRQNHYTKKTEHLIPVPFFSPIWIE